VTDTRATGFAALNHDWEYDPDAIAPTCTETGLGHRHCQRCDADEAGTTPYPALGHTVTSWSMKTAADCITSEIEEGTCTVCEEEQERYSPINHALGHTLDLALKVSVSFGVFEAPCTVCGDLDAHEFTYAIGGEGPAGGIIFYVADNTDGRPDGITIQGYGNSDDNGYFATYTAYYLEVTSTNIAQARWQATSGNTLIDGITTWANNAEKDAGLAASIGVGRKDTQTIVNSAAFAALTNTAAQICASRNAGGKTDWFLPSLGELNEVYKARVAGVTGLPTTNGYWSSSQTNNDNAWFLNFGTGAHMWNGKEFQTTNCIIRAIRAF